MDDQELFETLVDAIDNAQTSGEFGSSVEYVDSEENYLDFKIDDKNCRLIFVVLDDDSGDVLDIIRDIRNQH